MYFCIHLSWMKFLSYLYFIFISAGMACILSFRWDPPSPILSWKAEVLLSSDAYQYQGTIYVTTLTIIGSDNGLSPGRHQAIIWTKSGILLTGPLVTYFSEISIEIYAVSITKIHLKISHWKWRPFCPGLNVFMAPKLSNRGQNSTCVFFY